MRQWMGIGVIALGSLLAGCQGMLPGGGDDRPPEVIDRTSQAPGSKVVERQVAFPAGTYAKLEKRGNATIKGRLRYTTRQGQTLVGANEKISIAPATEYSAEAADVALAGKRIAPADPRAREYTHYARTDGDGYFVADGIPAGVFYVAGSVPLPDGQSRSPLILKQVKVGAGQTREVDLSR